MAVLVFRTEKMTRRRVLGLVLGFVGAATILGVWQGVGGSSLAGQLMCLTAAACYGVAIPYTRRFITPRPVSGLAVSASQLLIATVLLGMIAPLVGGGFPDVTELSGPVVASVAALGVLGTGLAFVLHMRNIRLLGASTASMVTYLIPVFATVIGVTVLGEHLAWFEPVGAAIVLLGVAIAQGVGRLGGLARGEGDRAVAAARGRPRVALLPGVGGGVQSGRAGQPHRRAGVGGRRTEQDHLAGGLGRSRAAGAGTLRLTARCLARRPHQMWSRCQKMSVG